MKISKIFTTTLLAATLPLTSQGTENKQTNPWEKDPILKSINLSAQTIMSEYEDWAKDWAKEERKPLKSDQIINRLTEGFFITLIQSLKSDPNPKLQDQMIQFLDTTVPPQFDDTWRFIFIECTNLNHKAKTHSSTSDHLENLTRRAVK